MCGFTQQAFYSLLNLSYLIVIIGTILNTSSIIYYHHLFINIIISIFLFYHQLNTNIFVCGVYSTVHMVRMGGLEPPRDCSRQPLKLVRLPFRHIRMFDEVIIAFYLTFVNSENKNFSNILLRCKVN